MSTDNSNKENLVVPGRSLDGANLSFKHLLYIQYRLKASSEVKFLLKRSPICGFDFKCQLCKSLLKANELQKHCGKTKHIKKMKDVAELFYNRSERVLQLFCDPRLQVNFRDTRLPLVAIPSSANNSLGQAPSRLVEISSEPLLENNEHLITTSNTENCCCKERLDPASLEKSNFESKNCLQIDVQSNAKTLSSLQISAYKKILFTNFHKNVTKANFYDFDCDWKIIVIHTQYALLCSLYSVGKRTKSVVAAISQYYFPSMDEYAVLAVLRQPIVKQPVVHLSSNITYWSVWGYLWNLDKPTIRHNLLSNMSLETSTNNSTLTNFRQNHIYLYLDCFPTLHTPPAEHLTFHSYNIPSTECNEAEKCINNPQVTPSAKTNESIGIEADKNLNGPKGLDHMHIFNLHLDNFNMLGQLHAQEMFDIFMNLPAQSKEAECSFTKTKVSCHATSKVEQGDFHQSFTKESVNMATSDSGIFSKKCVNLYLDHFSTMRNFQYQEKLYKGSVNQAIDAQKIQSNSQDIQYNAQNIQSNAQNTQSISKDIQSNSQNIQSNVHKIPSNSQKTQSKSQDIQSNSQKIQLNSQDIQSNPQEIRSVKPCEPICQFADKMDSKIFKNKYINLCLDNFPDLEPKVGQNCLCIFESKKSNDAEVSPNYPIQPKMSFMKFMAEYSELEPEDLLKVQYQTVSGDWFFLFSYDGNTISCNLCEIVLPSDSKQILHTHIKSRFHQILQKSINQMYHPIYYSTKRRWIPVKHIQDTKNSCQAVNSNKETNLNTAQLDDEFKVKYLEMPMNELYRIQYRTNSVDWRFMFTKSGPFYLCNLCGNTSMSSWNILNHLKRKAHTKLVKERVTGMHHPQYFPQTDPSFPVNPLTDIVEPIPSTSEAASSEKLSSEEMPIKPLHQSQLKEAKPFLFKAVFSQTDKKSTPEVPAKSSKQLTSGENQATDLPKIKSLEGEYGTKLKKLKSFFKMRDGVYQKQIISQSWVKSTLKKSIHSQSFEVFKINYVELNAETLLEVKYIDPEGQWISMITLKDGYIYACNLCGAVPLGNTQNLKIHILGAKHKDNIQKISKMYHPTHYKSQEACSTLSAKTEVVAVNKNSSSNNFSNNINGISGNKLEKFKIDYVELITEALLEIKYMDPKGQLIPMITLKDDYIYTCNLCGAVPLGNSQNLKAHILGVKHKKNIEKISKMYHPIHYKSQEACSTPSAKTEVVAVNNNSSSNNFSNNINEISGNKLEKFKIDYVELITEALLEIKYMDPKGQLIPMITLKDDYIYTCNLCGAVPLGNPQNLKAHILGVKHKNNLKKISKMYHPIHYKSQGACSTPSGKTEILTVNKNTSSNNSSINVSGISGIKLEKFKIDYVQLNVENLLEVKYMDPKEHWIPMITLKDEYIYICNLCGAVPLGNSQNLKIHILGAKHKENLKSINKMYHPIHYISQATYSTSSTDTEILAVKKNTSSNNFSDNIRGVSGNKLEEFKKNYVKMRIEEMCKIRYRTDSNCWNYMFESDKSGYICNLCGTKQIGRDLNFELHIQGCKHVSQLELIREIYHPSLCTSNSAAQTKTGEFSLIPNSLQSVPPPWVSERKQMGNLNEFKLQYIDLSISNLLMVQYQTDEGKWAFLLAFDKSRYKCNLCEVYVGNDFNLEIHLRGLFHTNEIMKCKLFHPFFCPGTKDIPALPPKQTVLTFKDATAIKSMDVPIDAFSRLLAECLRKTITRAESISQDGFKWIYKWLDIDIIMNIEFQTDTKPWNYMFAIEADTGLYICQLCDEQVVHLQTDAEVKRHVCSNFHSEHMNKIKSIYHENLCAFAPEKKAVPTIKDRLQNIVSCTEYLVEVSMGSEIPVGYKSVIARYQNILFESFIQECAHLDIKTLKCIQYKTPPNKWENMIASNESGYICNLCQGEFLGSVDFVTCHIQLDRHIRLLNSVEAVRHRLYEPFIRKALTHSGEIQEIVKIIEENRKVETDYKKFQKVTIEEFKISYMELHIDDIFEIQYKNDSENTWDFMFVRKSGILYCNICRQTIILRNDRIKKHVLSIFHMENMESIRGLYHPVFQPIKHFEKEKLQDESLSKNIQKQQALLQSILKKFANTESPYEKPDDECESETAQDLDISSQNNEEICSKKPDDECESETAQDLDISSQNNEEICSKSNLSAESQLLDQHKTDDGKISKKPSVFYNKLTEQELTRVEFSKINADDWQYVLTSTLQTVYFCKICDKSVGLEESAIKHTRGPQHIKCINKLTEEIKYPDGSTGAKITGKEIGIDYLLNTKYREIQCNKFRRMLVSTLRPAYECHLCEFKSAVLPRLNIYSHCHGSRHMKKLKNTKLRHPIYCILYDTMNSTSEGNDPQSSAKDSNITPTNVVDGTPQLTVDGDVGNETVIKSWIEKCAEFTANDLLKIQYRASKTNDWRNMISKSKKVTIFKCKVCDKALKSRTHLVAHTTTQKHIHQLAMKTWALRYPNYYIAFDTRRLMKTKPNVLVTATQVKNLLNLANRTSNSSFEDETPQSDSEQNQRHLSKLTVDYFNLSEEEHLRVEYRRPDSQNWSKIFSLHENVIYVCRLCQRKCIINSNGIITHFSTRKHLGLMKSTVKEWRHSVLCNSNGSVREGSNDKREKSNGQGASGKVGNELADMSKQVNASEIEQTEKYNLSDDDQSVEVENAKARANSIDTVRSSEIYVTKKSSYIMPVEEDRLEILKVWTTKYSGLPLDEFLKVQYRAYSSTQWNDLIEISTQEQFICQLCDNERIKYRPKAKKLIFLNISHVNTKGHLNHFARLDYKVRHPQFIVCFDHPVENYNGVKSESQKREVEYKQLGYDDLFELQYWDSISNKWLNMIRRENIEIFICTVCNKKVKSLSSLSDHFRGKLHLIAMKQIVCEFRHPKFNGSSDTSTISANNDGEQSQLEDDLRETCSSVSQDGKEVQDKSKLIVARCIKCDMELDTGIMTHLAESEECMKHMEENFPSFAENLKQCDNYNDVSEAILKETYLYIRRRIEAPSIPNPTVQITDSSNKCATSEGVLTASDAKSDTTLYDDSCDGEEILNAFPKNENRNIYSNTDLCVFHLNENLNPQSPSANTDLAHFCHEESTNPSNMVVATSSLSIKYNANSLTKSISKKVASGSSVTSDLDKFLIILKQLTALESILGVLGPRATDLLTKTLALQPFYIDSTECVLITSDNVLFLETVREKLLGLIEIGVLDSKLEVAAKRVLYDIIEFIKTGDDNVIII